jgi:catalase
VTAGAKVDELSHLATSIEASGAVPRFLSSRLGRISGEGDQSIEIDGILESLPSVLFDGLVLPDGRDGVASLLADGRTLEFVKDQYRHCKPIFVLGASSTILERAGISAQLPSGESDPGLILGAFGEATSRKFSQALAAHRHFAREQHPPLV